MKASTPKMAVKIGNTGSRDATSKYPQGCITGRGVGGIVAVVAEALAVSKEEDKEGHIVEQQQHSSQ